MPSSRFSLRSLFAQLVGVALLVAFAWALITPNLLRSRHAANEARYLGFTGTPELRTASLQETAQRDDATRKLLRRGTMRISTRDPEAAADELRASAEELGGFVAELTHRTRYNSRESQLSLRVPAERFGHMRERVRVAATDVLDDNVTAQDVTKEYFDLGLTLRNYRAEEEQYLAVMKRAAAVKDILEVSKHLAEVRGRIHQAEGELRFLAHQVDMAALNVTLVTDEAAKAFGTRWRPMVRLKDAFYDGVDAVGEFGSAMAGFIFLLPAILLWAAFILLLVVVAWRVLRVVAKLLKTQPTETPPAT